MELIAFELIAFARFHAREGMEETVTSLMREQIVSEPT
jgi:hypothetical protein